MKSQIFFKTPTKRLTKHESVLRTFFVSVLITDSQSYITWIPSTTHLTQMIRMPSIQQPEEISWIRFPANVYQSLKIAASLEDKLDIRMNRFKKSLNDMKNSFITPTAPLKAVEETAAVGNFIQNRQQNVSNQMRPPGFNQPTHQNNNQNRFQGNNFNQNQNRQQNQGAIYQNRPQQNLNYQAPPQQNTVTQGKFEAYTIANDANINNLQLKF
nr:hypothetical protein [Tanacetum cinerariifolium]